MNNKPKIAVLMSTYNGEKYLKEQIDSILAQKEVEVYLFVRDDVSSDRTLSILEKYKEQNKLNYVIGKKNIGAGCSFLHLLYKTPEGFDYYAWSDQDDVWLDDKLESAVNLINKSGKQLYMSNLMCVDKNLNEIGLRNNVPADTSVYSIMCENQTNGCTMVFTNSFRNILVDVSRRPDDSLFMSRYHDTWTGMVGAIQDEIIYDFNQHILYRQHEANEVGSIVYNSPAKKMKVKLKKIRNSGKRNGRSKAAVELVRCYPEYINGDEFILALANPNKLANKVKLIKMYSFYRKHATQDRLSYILYVLFGLI